MNRRAFPIIPLLLMCAMGLGAYWLYKNVELEKIEYQVGENEEARSNRLLAAMRLLEQQGFNFNVAKNRGVFSSLDVNKTGVLWIANLNELSSRQEVDEVYAWVESGGVLITSPVNASAFDESTASGEFLAKIGIASLTEFELDAMRENPELSGAFDNGQYHLDLPANSENSTRTRILSIDAPYFKNASTNTDDTHVVVSPHVIQKGIGDGFITVYADASMFDNDGIDWFEHGYLLLWLTEPAKQKNLSIVFKPAEKPGLIQFIWNRFTLAIFLFGVLLVGFLRWASSRLGPVEHELAPIQNNLMAHLAARGEFWYRHNYTDKVAENVQSAALENLLKRRGLSGKDQAGTTIDKAESIKQASELLKCSPVTAEDALFGSMKKDAAILSASRALQKINHRKPFQP